MILISLVECSNVENKSYHPSKEGYASVGDISKSTIVERVMP